MQQLKFQIKLWLCAQFHGVSVPRSYSQGRNQLKFSGEGGELPGLPPACGPSYSRRKSRVTSRKQKQQLTIPPTTNRRHFGRQLNLEHLPSTDKLLPLVGTYFLRRYCPKIPSPF